MKKLISLLRSIWQPNDAKTEESFFSYKYNGRTLSFGRSFVEGVALSNDEVMVVSPEWIEWQNGKVSYSVFIEQEAYHSQVLGDVTIPSQVIHEGKTYTVRGIYKYAFNNCENLMGITLPTTITYIGNSAFWRCNNLTTIDIPPLVAYIGRKSFYGCSNLLSIEIPSSVAFIGDEAFCNCSSLTSIVVQADNTKYDSRNNCNAIIETSTDKLIIGCKNTIIPSTITTIGEGAFMESGIVSVDLPNSIISIGHNAFENCNNLERINIPDSVISIGSDTFQGCNSLTRIDLPSSVASIGGHAFSNCSRLENIVINVKDLSKIEPIITNCRSLVSVTLGYSVDSMIQNFAGCYNIENIFIENNNPPTYFEHKRLQIIHKDVSRAINVFVPKGRMEIYKKSWYWKDFNIQEYDFSAYSSKDKNTNKDVKL